MAGWRRGSDGGVPCPYQLRAPWVSDNNLCPIFQGPNLSDATYHCSSGALDSSRASARLIDMSNNCSFNDMP